MTTTISYQSNLDLNLFASNKGGIKTIICYDYLDNKTSHVSLKIKVYDEKNNELIYGFSSNYTIFIAMHPPSSDVTNFFKKQGEIPPNNPQNRLYVLTESHFINNTATHYLLFDKDETQLQHFIFFLMIASWK